MIDRLRELSGSDVSRETYDRLTHFARLLTDESQHQNLVSRASLAELWERHIFDAAQLIGHAPGGQNWCDIGSGAGLPGMVLAIISGQPATLIEPRRLRAEFLSRAAAELGLEKVSVVQAKAEQARGSFDRITARAVANLDALLGLALHLSHPGTTWLLPKGKSAKSELDEALRNWQGEFRLEQSRTQADAWIVVASNVRRKGTA